MVCFDLGGTLLDTGPSFAAALQRLSLRQLLRHEWNVSVNLAREGYERGLRRLALDLQVDAAEVLRLAEESRQRRPRLFEDTLPTLAKLEHLRCVGLSNAAAWMVSPDLLGLERHLSDILYSYEIGHAKPDVEAFRCVERVTGARPEEILMVGDSLVYDYRGAVAAGWWGKLLDRQRRHLGEADRIESLGDLLSCVGTACAEAVS